MMLINKVLYVVLGLSWRIVWSSGSLLLPEGGPGGGGGGNRNLENVLSRLSSRLDVIALRIDHLDNRLGRFQAAVNNRLDGIENSLSATKLRVEMMTDEVTRVDENLSRKWKNLETKLETSLVGLDAKYDSKLNIVLREGRRVGESLHGIFSGVEKRVTSLVSQVNTTLIQFIEMSNSSLRALQTYSASFEFTTTTTTTTTPKPPTTGTTTAQPNTNLITNKISNMFDDLTERAVRMENSIRETLVISNATRRDLQDNFRTIMASRSRAFSSSSSAHSHGSSSSSSSSGSAINAEATSMAILETLASTESMSTAISRRLNELTRSIEERFELVSMTLNGFFESCLRIQEGAPLIEEHIAELLDKILNSFENSTSCPDYSRLMEKLDTMDYKCDYPETSASTVSSPVFLLPGSSSNNNNNNSSTTTPAPNPNHNSNSNNNNNYEELVRNAEHLPEEDKKLLWDSLFPSFPQNLTSSYVPE